MDIFFVFESKKNCLGRGGCEGKRCENQGMSWVCCVLFFKWYRQIITMSKKKKKKADKMKILAIFANYTEKKENRATNLIK